MFYEGDLQSGIAKAMQESKLVACFVTDEGDESTLWEKDFLQQPALNRPISECTVLLRLKAESQEANYLAAIFPVPKTPTLILIKNGELKEYIAAGIVKDEFNRRVLGVFSPTANETSQETGATSSSTTPSQNNTSNNTVHVNTEAQTLAPSSSSSHQPASSSSPQQPQVVQDLLLERSTRLEAHKKEQEAKEKAKRVTEAKARKAAMEEAAAPDSRAAADRKYALMQKKRQQEARDERSRILKRVEDDKTERRRLETNRKALAKSVLEHEGQATPTAASSNIPSAAASSKECALQIRLFDGSSIRSRFPSLGTLRGDVRPWVDQKQEGDTPYTFKQILTPLPNKNIETSEEEGSLYSLGLTPSSTLILVPVTGYTSAYEGNASGIVTRSVSAGFGLVSSGVGIVTNILGSVLGSGGNTGAPAPESQQAHSPSSGPSANINVRTLRDQQRPEDQQFYNGNALNFEPRKDDDKKQD